MVEQTDRTWLTTGQAATLCSVTPDTVLKWIKKGWVSGVRTAGGHYRIERRELEPLIVAHRPADGTSSQLEESDPAGHCWEYLSDRGTLRDDCQRCVVYRVQAARCYLMAGLEPDVGHARVFCQTSCEDCVYYRRVNGLPTKVLLITSADDFVDHLAGEEDERIELRFARNGYEASAIIPEFRPAFAVIDAEQLGGNTELLDSLAADRRVPGLRIVLGVPRGKGRNRRWQHNDLMVGVLEKPIGIGQIAAVIDRVPVRLPDAGGRHPVGYRKKGITMTGGPTPEPDSTFDEDGFLKALSEWNPAMAQALAERNDIGPLTEQHWAVIEFVKDYYQTYATGPPVVKICKATGLSRAEICSLFPCGVVRGAYRLAGLPRPAGCF